jgi:ABC-2 type transport system permease protein
MVLDFFAPWAPRVILDAISSFSFITHFSAIIDGVIDVRDIIFFASLIAFWLFANAIVVDFKKAAG